MRISGYIILNPILGRRTIPVVVKSGMIMVLSVIVYSYYTDNISFYINTPIVYGVLLLKEFIIGFAFGIVTNFFMFIIVYGCEIIDLQMGISMSKVYDAQSNSSLSLTSTIYNGLFMMLFFAEDGHVALIRTFITSGDVVPYGNIIINESLSTVVLSIFCQCVILAIKFSMPMLAMQFVAQIGVGILMKTIPQINVFVINMQMKLFIGIIVLLILFSPMSTFLDNMILVMFEALDEVINVIH